MTTESLNTLFAAGAYSALDGRGLCPDAAAELVDEICKSAAAKHARWDEDGEPEGKTWWSRNKHWALPTAIGAGAFLIGADAGRNGRPDRNPFSNAGSLLWERVKALVGIPNSALRNAITEIAPERKSESAGPDLSFMTNREFMKVREELGL